MSLLDAVKSARGETQPQASSSGSSLLRGVQSVRGETPATSLIPDHKITQPEPKKGILKTIASAYTKIAETNRDIIWGKPTTGKKESNVSKLKKAFPGTTEQIQSISKKAEPKNIISNVWEAIKQPTQEYLKRIGEEKKISKDTPKSEVIGKKISTLTAGAGVLFTPVHAVLTAASDIPVISKIAKAIMVPFIAVGEAADINANLVIDQLPISNEDKNNLRQPVGELSALVAQLALGKYTHIQTKKVSPLIKSVGKKTITKMTKEAIVDYKLSKTVTINGKLLRDIRNNGKITNAEIKDAFKSAKLTGKQQADIMRGKTPAVDVKIPASKVITLIDKPYWEKIKSVFNIKPSEPITLTIQGGESITVPHISGLLEAGKYTPEAIITKVATTSLKNTPSGKKMVKLAVKAQETGGEITVEKVADVTKGGMGDIKEPLTKELTKYKSAEEFYEGFEPDDIKSAGYWWNESKETVDYNPKVKEVSEMVRSEVMKLDPKAKVYLSGSWPNATARENSDIDFYIRSNILEESDLSKKGYDAFVKTIHPKDHPKVTAYLEVKPVTQPPVSDIKQVAKPKKSAKKVVTPKKVETKGKTTSKIARSIERKAIEQKLTRGFEGKAGFDRVTVKDQAKRASKVMKNLDEARRMVRGEIPLPEGLKGASLITAMEENIKRTGNAELAQELANSPLVAETSVHAQELRLLAEREPDSLAARLMDLKKLRKERFEQKTKKSLSESVKKEVSNIKKTTKIPDKYDWNNFISSIECA